MTYEANDAAKPDRLEQPVDAPREVPLHWHRDEATQDCEGVPPGSFGTCQGSRVAVVVDEGFERIDCQEDRLDPLEGKDGIYCRGERKNQRRPQLRMPRHPHQGIAGGSDPVET